MVTIKFGDEVIATKNYRRTTRNLRVGDFLEFGGELVRVEAVQFPCPYLENLKRSFVMVTGKTATGRIVPMRQLPHTVLIWRKARS